MPGLTPRSKLRGTSVPLPCHPRDCLRLVRVCAALTHARGAHAGTAATAAFRVFRDQGDAAVLPPASGEAAAVVEPPPALRTFLKQPLAVRWAQFEWFRSTLDDAVLRDDEFRQCLRGLDVPGADTATLLGPHQWSYLRWKLGRTRRLSPSYLKHERERLELRRTKIRALQRMGGLVRCAARPRPDAAVVSSHGLMSRARMRARLVRVLRL